MALQPKDVARVKAIDSFLSGTHNTPLSFFSHSGGKTSLRAAREVWEMAKELIEIAKKEFPPAG